MNARKTSVKSLSNGTCKQISDLVLDYLTDKMRPRTKRDFQQHLRICPDCVNFVRTYRKTVKVTRSVRYEDIPSKMRKRVLTFLRAKMGKTQAV